MNRNEKVYALIVGIVFAMAVFLMVDGRIFGDSTSGFATVLLIISIGLFTSGPKSIRILEKRLKSID